MSVILRSPAASALAMMNELAASSYGPAGRSKIVRSGIAGGALLVTTTSHRLFGALRLEHPVARVLLDLLASRQARGADGGLFTVMVASSLLLAASRRRLPPRLLTFMLQQELVSALGRVLGPGSQRPQGRRRGAPSASVALRMSDLTSLLALVRSVLSPKRVGVPTAADGGDGDGGDGGDGDGGDGEWWGDERQMCLLVVSAFVRSIPDAVDESSSAGRRLAAREDAAAAGELRASPSEGRALALLPSVRLLHVVGPRACASRILPGVLLDTPLPPGAALPTPPVATGWGGVRVALYNVSLEATLPEELDAATRLHVVNGDGDGGGGGGGGARAGAAGGAAGVAAEALLRAFADGVAAAGVQLLICQQRVAPALVRLLLARRVLPLPRISLRHVGAVRRLTGATPLSHLSPPDASALGRVGGAAHVSLGGRTYLQLLPPPPPPPARAAAAAAPSSADAVERRPATGLSLLPQPVLTLALCAPNRSASEELGAAVSCALATLGAAMRQRRPRLVPGAGCFEALLAAELRRDDEGDSGDGGDGGDGEARDSGPSGGAEGADEARAQRRLRREARELLAASLEQTIAALAGGGLAGREAAEAVGARNAEAGAGDPLGGGARAYYGWHAHDGRPFEVMRVETRDGRGGGDGEDCSSSSSDDDGGGDGDDEQRGNSGGAGGCPSRGARLERAAVVELQSEKLEALHGALELAGALMGVDDVIVDTR